MNSFLSKDSIKAVFALSILLSIIVGFFMGMIPTEYFTGIAGLIIAHYFESQKTDIVQKELENKVAEIESLKGDIKILSNG